MRTLSATEASRGFSDLLDAVEHGESVTVTRGGRAVAEIRPIPRRAGRDLRLALESRCSSVLTEEDADDMVAVIEGTRELLTPAEDPWAGR